MQKKRKIAFNTNQIFFFVLLFIFICLAIFFLTDSEDGDIALSVAGVALSAAPIFAIVISPVIYIFEDDKLTIVYCLGIKEVIAWKEIRSVTKRGGWFKGTGRGMPVYEIAYSNKKKIPFFVEASVAHNKKTKKLMKEYYKNNIEEY